MQRLQRNKQGTFRERRRFGGKTGLRVWDRSRHKYIIVPRSHQAKSTTRAAAGFSSGDTAERPMQSNNSRMSPYWVGAPTKRWHRRGIVRHATTGEQIN